MADPVIVNTPKGDNSDNGMGFLLGVLILIIFVVFMIVYGLPYIRSSLGSPQINVPGKINVDINKK